MLDEEINEGLTNLVACEFFAHGRRSENLMMTDELYQSKKGLKLQVEGWVKEKVPNLSVSGLGFPSFQSQAVAGSHNARVAAA
jgi:hypothetical protein